MHVISAADGTTALDLAERHRPDVVLADFDMPGLNGAQLCHAMREHPQLRSVPVAILTGYLVAGDPRTRGISFCALMFQPRSNKELIAIAHQLIEQGNHNHDQDGACLLNTGTAAPAPMVATLVFSPPFVTDYDDVQDSTAYSLPDAHPGRPRTSPRSWRIESPTPVGADDLDQ